MRQHIRSRPGKTENCIVNVIEARKVEGFHFGAIPDDTRHTFWMYILNAIKAGKALVDNYMIATCGDKEFLQISTTFRVAC